jgi:hypothetical protein
MGISRDVAERLANGRFVAIHRRLILVKFPTAFLLNREANGPSKASAEITVANPSGRRRKSMHWPRAPSPSARTSKSALAHDCS